MFAEEMIEMEKEAQLEWAIKIAECFQDGDAEKIAFAIQSLRNWYGEDLTPGGKERHEALRRAERAARLAEDGA